MRNFLMYLQNVDCSCVTYHVTLIFCCRCEPVWSLRVVFRFSGH